MTTASDSYSSADRCMPCGGRATLTESKANALVIESFGGLEMFICRDDGGWHVWAPQVEQGLLQRIGAV